MGIEKDQQQQHHAEKAQPQDSQPSQSMNRGAY
jgi:hypothetical protein